MPPTGMSRVSFGSTARIERTTLGAIISPGKSLSASAPAASAAKASLGVATPGIETRPRFFAARTTSASKFGETTRRAPASAICATACVSRTVPAPIRRRVAKHVAIRAMLTSGEGEFNGTSRMRKPPSKSTVATSTASSGRSPRKMAISGSLANASSNPMAPPFGNLGDDESAAHRGVRRAEIGLEPKGYCCSPIDLDEMIAPDDPDALARLEPAHLARFAKFHADDEPREIIGSLRWGELAREPPRAHGEEVRKEAASLRAIAGDLEAMRESAPIRHGLRL